MSFINMGEGFEDVKDPETVPEGKYDLVIEGGSEKEENGVLKGLNIRIGIEGNPDAATVFHFISIPQPEDDEGKVKNKQRFAKKFCDLFGVDLSGDGFELADLSGATATAYLTLSEYNDQVSNKIKL